MSEATTAEVFPGWDSSDYSTFNYDGHTLGAAEFENLNHIAPDHVLRAYVNSFGNHPGYSGDLRTGFCGLCTEGLEMWRSDFAALPPGLLARVVGMTQICGMDEFPVWVAFTLTDHDYDSTYMVTSEYGGGTVDMSEADLLALPPNLSSRVLAVEPRDDGNLYVTFAPLPELD